MHTIYAINAPDANKLTRVIEQMRSLGAPTLNVVDCGDHYMALEGSHRLAAAHELGLAPMLIVWSQDETLDISRYDWCGGANWVTDSQTKYPAGEVAAELYSAQVVAYQFESIG